MVTTDVWRIFSPHSTQPALQLFSMETRHATRNNYANAARAGAALPPGAPLNPPPAPVPNQPQQQPRHFLQLPAYWNHNPEGWFAFIEARFRANQVMDEAARFDIAASNLSEEAVDLVLDLLRDIPVGRPYGVLKDRLLRRHVLTPLQKAEALRTFSDLGDRSPSQLLTAMLKVCPDGETETVQFKHAFLSRLPENLSLLLGNFIRDPVRDIAERADGHWATQRSRKPQNGSGINAVDEAEAQDDLIEAVNAVRFQGKGKGKGSFRGRNGKSGKGPAKAADGGSRTGGLQTAPPESGLCSYHWSFGKGARSCTQPCSWTGN